MQDIASARMPRRSSIFRTARNSGNDKFVENVASLNVKRSVGSIVARSFILEQMIAKGEIAIIGAKHDLDSGAVEFYADTLLSSQADMQRKLGG